jgi:endoglycosylceramidase
MKPSFAFGLLPLLAACHSSSSPSSPSTTYPTCTLARPSPPDWRLVPDGTVLRDGLGRAILLRGVDAGGRSKFAPYVPFDYDDAGYAGALDAYMAHAAKWGIDVMRVPFTWAALEPVEGTNDADWLSRYDQLVASAWSHGIWTILDFHQDVYSEVFCGDGFPGWTVNDAGPPMHDCPNWDLEYLEDPSVEQAFDAFWAQGSPLQPKYLAAWTVMVDRYKNTPGVLGFEPMNEPGWGTADEPTFSATTLTAFYSEMVPFMRSLAPSALVFIDAPGADGISVMTSLGRPTWDGGDPDGGDGVVFAPHYYPLGGSTDNVTSLKVWQEVGSSWNVPVFVGEFGESHTLSTAPTDMAQIFDALDVLSLGGSEWEYSVAAESWNSESDGIVQPDGADYPVAQAVQRPYARAVAGSGITQGFDSTSSTSAYSLTYTPDASGGTAVTEVALPAGAYPSGYTVTLQGACADATSVPGTLLVQPSSGSTRVSLQIERK